MAVRTITSAERVDRHQIANGTWNGPWTVVTMNCGHQRTLGNHLLNGVQYLTKQLVGMECTCNTDVCSKTPSA